MLKYLFALALILQLPVYVLAQTDAIDLHTASIANSPKDVADWPITVAITRVEMSTGMGFQFDAAIPDSWDYHVPGWGAGVGCPNDGCLLYTVWPVFRINGQLATSGIVQMWKYRDGTGAFETATWHTEFPKNWAYDSRWGGLAGYQPNPGELIGFFLTAGDARGPGGVTSRRERTNVVAFSLPAGDHGVFTFGGVPAPVPTPTPTPVPAPTPVPTPSFDPSGILARLDALEASVGLLGARVRVLEARPVPVSCSVSAVYGVRLSCRLGF